MKNILLPVLIGAAAAGAIAWFLTSDDTAELREQLLGKASESFGSLKEKVIDKLNA
jgi:gas vesicle protein